MLDAKLKGNEMKLTFSRRKLAKSSEKFFDSQNKCFCFCFDFQSRALSANAYAHVRLEQGKRRARAGPQKTKCKQNKLSFTQNFLDILSLRL